MRISRQRLIGFVWFVCVLILLNVMFSASFFLTAFIYRIAGLDLPGWSIQIINSLLGLVLAGLIINLIAKVARSRGWIPEMNVFGPIIEALERIARGDFSTRLEDDFPDNQIVGKLAESVNKMALELDQMENLRQEFISNVSHEIQTPLTSIRGFALALEDDRLSPEERSHYLNIIKEESNRLSRITADLLKLASLESEQLKFEPKRYRVDNQIRNLVLACEPQWRDKSIEMDISLREMEIVADEDLLGQVWTNLIHNSLKFTPQAASIKVTLRPCDGQVEFRISDTGIGISAEDQVRIFERFYKADQSRTRSNGGSGLGLSIVKKIVEMHKGTIQVESELGQGTTFTILLPQGIHDHS